MELTIARKCRAVYNKHKEAIMLGDKIRKAWYNLPEEEKREILIEAFKEKARKYEEALDHASK